MVDAATVFEQHRSRLQALAYRMLGSMSEAEDAVQDVFLRWLQSDRFDVRSAEAWLVSVATRICIDRLRRLALERTAYAGQWLPEPVVGEMTQHPESRLTLASDLSMAFLIVLERLSPEERAVFILHDVFESSFAEIAAVVGKSEAACRQMAKRARERVREQRPRFGVSERAKKSLVTRFLTAIETGDKAALVSVLAGDAVLTSDGGGKVKVSKSGIRGGERIARLIQRGHFVPRHLRQDAGRIVRLVAPVNGELGIVTFLDGRPISTLSITTDGLRIQAIYQVLNPDKLVHVVLPERIVQPGPRT